MNIFEVFVKQKNANFFSPEDFNTITFVKYGFRASYFFMIYNVVYAFLRKFYLLSFILLVLEVMVYSVLKKLPVIPALLLEFSFSLFVASFASDAENFFLKRKAFIKKATIYSSNIKSAKDKFFYEYFNHLPHSKESFTIGKESGTISQFIKNTTKLYFLIKDVTLKIFAKLFKFIVRQ